MRFSEIIGHKKLKSQLIRSIESGQVAHAQLFLGPEGSPNMALALAYIAFLNCRNRSLEDSCGECDSCRKIDRLIHPDLHFAFPVCATKKVSGKDVVSASFLNEWRNFLIQDSYNNATGWNNYFGGENKQLNISKEESRQIIKNLSLKAFDGQYKVMLIWLPEYMNASSANAILKILEEPPENTLFLLVSNDEKRLISTILSRTQIIQISPFSDDEINTMLVEQHFIEKEKARQIAHLVDGNINKALSLAREVEDDSHEMFRDWMRLCYVGNLKELIQWTDKFSKMTRVSQQTLFQYGLSMMREALIASTDEMRLSRLMGEELNFATNFMKILNIDIIEEIMGQFDQAIYHLERYAHAKILFLDVSLCIFEIFNRQRTKAL